ncbi:MAG: hypothetical protein QOI36_4439, partial [Pseudonocardiales bacterium]|nr:hypothetical protein [Pseudonocardiales bacterium]
MTNNARPRHAAPGRASRIAGRAALGVLGAPMAMLAIAGPAGAAEADLSGHYTDGEASGSTDVSHAQALPGLSGTDVAAFPTSGLPTNGLPTDGLDLQGIDLGLLNLGGGGAGLPQLPVAAPDLSALQLNLPSTDALPSLPSTPALPSLPSADSLPSLPVVGALPSLPSLPVVGDLPSLPSLPSADSLPSLASLPVVGDLPSLPSTDSLPSLP